MRNPYQVLGLSPQADLDEIKSAYRRLAKETHPDSGNGSASQQARFHEVTAAYNLLRRKQSEGSGKRHPAREAETPRRPDTGKERPEPASKPKADARPERNDRPKPEPSKPGKRQASFSETLRDVTGNANQRGFSKPEEKSPDPKPESGFSDFLSGLKRAGRRAFSGTGGDHTYELSIPFMDAAKGTKRRLTLEDGRTLDVHIPAGIDDGQQIRLRGQGGSRLTGSDAGDALVTINIVPHPTFHRDGADIHINVPISLPEAVLGSKISVQTIDGPVSLTVPPGANTGTVLRLKGKGLLHANPRRHGARGDQFVSLAVKLPDRPDDALKDFVATWAAGMAHDPRKERS